MSLSPREVVSMGFEPVGLESAVSNALDAVYEMVDSRRRWGFGIGEFGADEPADRDSCNVGTAFAPENVGVARRYPGE